MNIVKSPTSTSSGRTVSREGRLKTIGFPVPNVASSIDLQPRDDPALAEVVVHDEHAAWLQPLADVLERLRREQVTFQPDVAVAAVEHERVDERVDDQVVLLRRRMQDSCGRRPGARSRGDRRTGGRDD